MIGNKQAELIKAIKNHKCCGKNDDSQGGGEGSTQPQSLLTSLIPSNCPKPDLFLISDNPDNDNAIDVTNYNIDDLINLLDGGQGTLAMTCLYESSNLNPVIVSTIEFSVNSSGRIRFTAYSILSNNDMDIFETSYNNKPYYNYYQRES